MFALYPNLCYNKVCDKWTAVNFATDLIYFYFIHLQQQPTVYIEDGQRKLHKIFPFNIKVSTSISRINIGVFFIFS